MKCQCLFSEEKWKMASAKILPIMLSVVLPLMPNTPIVVCRLL